MSSTATRPLPSFRELREFAATNSVARSCIEIRKVEIILRDWDLAPDPRFPPVFRRALNDSRSKWLRFFSRPDPDYGSFRAFLAGVLEQAFVSDSLALFRRDPTRLVLIDGAAIEPVLHPHGSLAGFNQHLHHVPRVAITERIEPLPCCHGGYADTDVWYLPAKQRTWTMFGRSPLEEALEDRDDGSEPGSDERLLEAFALPGTALGILDGYEPDPAKSAAWSNLYLDWLRGIFDRVLEGTGLRWEWKS